MGVNQLKVPMGMKQVMSVAEREGISPNTLLSCRIMAQEDDARFY